MLKLSLSLVSVSLLFSASCYFRERHSCREHENWDGHYCHADRGYEHYWDHPDHREWRAEHHHDDDDRR